MPKIPRSAHLSNELKEKGRSIPSIFVCCSLICKQKAKCLEQDNIAKSKQSEHPHPHPKTIQDSVLKFIQLKHTNQGQSLT